jgi:anti-sigma factor RsiW
MKECDRYKSLIGVYVDDTADETEAAKVQTHLRECAGCAREVRELQSVRRLVTSLPTLHPSPRLMPAAFARLREQRIGWLDRVFGGWGLRELRLAATVATVLLVCILVGVATLHGVGPNLSPDSRMATAVRPYSAPAMAGPPAPTDEYLQACRLVHGTLDQDRAYWSPDAVQLASYAR